MKEFTEKEAEDFLEKRKITVVERTFVKNKKEIDKVKIKFPWVMKVSSKKIMHKVQFGGVELNITSLEKARIIFEKLSKIKNFEETLIQKQIEGKEAILGIKYTEEFGHTVMFGTGGSNTEKKKDVSFKAAPLSRKDRRDIIEETVLSKNLTKKEKENIKKTIKKIEKVISENKDISELDINPLMVTDKDCIVVDARIVMK